MLSTKSICRKMSLKPESQDAQFSACLDVNLPQTNTVSTLQTPNHGFTDKFGCSVVRTEDVPPFSFGAFYANKMNPELLQEPDDELNDKGRPYQQLPLSDFQLMFHSGKKGKRGIDKPGNEDPADNKIQKPLKHKRSKLVALKKIYALLIKFFLHEKLEVEDFRSLRKLEMHILAEILIRKNRASSIDK